MLEVVLDETSETSLNSNEEWKAAFWFIIAEDTLYRSRLSLSKRGMSICIDNNRLSGSENKFDTLFSRCLINFPSKFIHCHIRNPKKIEVSTESAAV